MTKTKLLYQLQTDFFLKSIEKSQGCIFCLICEEYKWKEVRKYFQEKESPCPYTDFFLRLLSNVNQLRNEMYGQTNEEIRNRDFNFIGMGFIVNITFLSILIWELTQKELSTVGADDIKMNYFHRIKIFVLVTHVQFPRHRKSHLRNSYKYE